MTVVKHHFKTIAKEAEEIQLDEEQIEIELDLA